MSKYEKIFIEKFQEKGGLTKIPGQELEIWLLKEYEPEKLPLKVSLELSKPSYLIKGKYFLISFKGEREDLIKILKGKDVKIVDEYRQNPETMVRSFRTDSDIVIENMIRALTQCLAYFCCKKGTFNDPMTGEIDKKNLDVNVEDALKHLYRKIRSSFFDGIRVFVEEQKK